VATGVQHQRPGNLRVVARWSKRGNNRAGGERDKAQTKAIDETEKGNRRKINIGIDSPDSVY